MAISRPHHHCLKELHRRGELPQGGAILEIGEANWYGDIMPPNDGVDSFDCVKRLYRDLLTPDSIVSIDMYGPTALKLDLNNPITLDRQFSVVINHGTLEHIFNPAQVLCTMHEHCSAGGLLIHESPFTGWIDHGFYTIQPTLYYDLAAANGYDVRYMAVTHIEHGTAVEIDSREHLLKMAASGGVANNSMLYVAMRKERDEPFKIPMQGYYAQTLSWEGVQAWRELR